MKQKFFYCLLVSLGVLGGFFVVFFLIEHLYSAHIHSIECSWRLADVLACFQKVSHPEMRLVSAAIGASLPIFLLRTLVHAGFCMFSQSCDVRTVTAGSLQCVLDVLKGQSGQPLGVFQISCLFKITLFFPYIFPYILSTPITP
jgi:hypothetical protein